LEEETQWRINVTEGVYTIENVNARHYLNVDRAKKENGAKIQLWDNPWNEETQWRINVVSEGIYTIENVRAAKYYLNADGGRKENGAKIYLWDNPGEAETQWRIVQVRQDEPENGDSGTGGGGENPIPRGGLLPVSSVSSLYR